MSSLIIRIAVAGLLALPVVAIAADKKSKENDPAHVKESVADHRVMAEAHLNAARCLESGKPEKDCHAQLAKDCKGLGIGKYCGMKHKH